MSKKSNLIEISGLLFTIFSAKLLTEDKPEQTHSYVFVQSLDKAKGLNPEQEETVEAILYALLGTVMVPEGDKERAKEVMQHLDGMLNREKLLIALPCAEENEPYLLDAFVTASEEFADNPRLIELEHERLGSDPGREFRKRLQDWSREQEAKMPRENIISGLKVAESLSPEFKDNARNN